MEIRRMKNISIIAICLTLASCTATKPNASDPIDDLVTQYNASYGLWINGTYPIIDLPPNAKPKEVLAEAVQKCGFDKGHITSYKIQEIRELTKLKVGDGEPPYMAALIESDLGTKIFLFRPESNNRWWVRFCDAPEEKQNK
jgi:hypothetical protein